MMPAGTYYIGDLCYVLSDRWDEFCSLTCAGSQVLDGEFNLADGTRFATFTTRWGDGRYQDQQGCDYPVDAGLIGCVRVQDITATELSGLASGRVIEFAQAFAPGSEQGVISFGTVEIDTDCTESVESEYQD